jgi:hypothetical protein
VAVSYAVANDVAPPPSKWVKDLPPLVDACFERALAKKANDRFLTSGEFAATLAAAFRGSAQVSAVMTAPLARRPQHAGASAIAAADAPDPSRPARNKPEPASALSAKVRPVAIVSAVVLAAVALAVARWYGQPEASANDDRGTRASETPARPTATPTAPSQPGAPRARPRAPRVPR